MKRVVIDCYVKGVAVVFAYNAGKPKSDTVDSFTCVFRFIIQQFARCCF